MESKKKEKSLLSDIINKDSVWAKIKKYVYLLTFLIVILLILLLCIFILNILTFLKLQPKNVPIPTINLSQ